MKPFGPPDYVRYLRALGPREYSRWEPKAIAQCLSYLEYCTDFGIVPNLYGKRERGLRVYDDEPVPADLKPLLDELAKGVDRCRRTLLKGDAECARQRLAGLADLADEITEQANPHLRRGVKVLRSARTGGKTSRKTRETARLVAYLDAGHSYTQAARKFRLTREAVAKRVQRARR